MAGVSADQIAAAKRVPAIEFLRRYRSDDLVPAHARGEFQLKSHDSFKINGESSVWHWKSQDIGGRSALDYLIHVEGVPFVEAVRQLCDERPGPAPVPHLVVQRRRPAFTLPPAAPTTARVERYLLGRGISPRVIRTCIRQGILYESHPWHNCVFVGRDETGRARYAALRSTGGALFKYEQAGSEKMYGFCIMPVYYSSVSTDDNKSCASFGVGGPLSAPVRRVSVFESAIDAMAEMTLCDDNTPKYRLSLGGIYAPAEGSRTSESVREAKALPSLSAFLQRHPQVCEIEVCLDNDHAGMYAADQIQRHYANKYRVIVNLPAIQVKDYADMAQLRMLEKSILQQEFER